MVEGKFCKNALSRDAINVPVWVSVTNCEKQEVAWDSIMCYDWEINMTAFVLKD